jgi:hypothetical protein
MKLTPAQKIRRYFNTSYWKKLKMDNKHGEYKPTQRITGRGRT